MNFSFLLYHNSLSVPFSQEFIPSIRIKKKVQLCLQLKLCEKEREIMAVDDYNKHGCLMAERFLDYDVTNLGEFIVQILLIMMNLVLLGVLIWNLIKIKSWNNIITV